MNTAEYRKQALIYESQLLWVRAAEAWELAVQNYPNNSGQLAKLDKDRMAKRAESCHATAKRRNDAAKAAGWL